MQTEVNNKVVTDISKRKYVISSREKTVESFFKQRMDNHKAKQVAKVNAPVVKVIKEIKEFGGDNKGVPLSRPRNVLGVAPPGHVIRPCHNSLGAPTLSISQPATAYNTLQSSRNGDSKSGPHSTFIPCTFLLTSSFFSFTAISKR